jgi:hypothetical protein
VAPWLIVTTGWPAAASVAGSVWARTGTGALAVAGAAVGAVLVLGVGAAAWWQRSRRHDGGVPAP